MHDVSNRVPKRKRNAEFGIYCRNEGCRLKLPELRENPHSAFCWKGCFEKFYKRKCIVCENPIERTINNRLLCKRPKCRTELRNWPAVYRPFHHGRLARTLPLQPTASSDPSEVPVNSGFKSLPKGIEWAVSDNSSGIRAPRRVLDAVFRRIRMMGVPS